MTPDYVSLAAFRYSIRRFLKAVDSALAEANVEPQQYQLMLAVKARHVVGEEASIRDLAETMLLTHHSCVGLIDRLERRGLVQRSRSTTDARVVPIELTTAGEATVARLATVGQSQLQLLGPDLIAALTSLIQSVNAAQHDMERSH